MNLEGAGQVRGRASRGGLVRFLRGREDAATLALLVQIAGFLVGPGLHLIGHRADHTHGPDGVTHTHEVPNRPDGSPSPTPLHDSKGSPLHFAVAVTALSLFVWTVAFTLLLTVRLGPPTKDIFTRALFDVPAPRGPPLAI
jgi:hypothetical protein